MAKTHHQQLRSKDHLLKRQNEQQIVDSLAPHVKMHSLPNEFASLPPNERQFNYQHDVLKQTSNAHVSPPSSSAVMQEVAYLLGNWRLRFKLKTECSICMRVIEAHEVISIPREECKVIK